MQTPHEKIVIWRNRCVWSSRRRRRGQEAHFPRWCPWPNSGGAKLTMYVESVRGRSMSVEVTPQTTLDIDRHGLDPLTMALWASTVEPATPYVLFHFWGPRGDVVAVRVFRIVLAHRGGRFSPCEQTEHEKLKSNYTVAQQPKGFHRRTHAFVHADGGACALDAPTTPSPTKELLQEASVMSGMPYEMNPLSRATLIPA